MEKKLSIDVAVKTQFLEDQSAVEYHFYIWAYEITITNNSEEMIQLLNRHWKITDMHSHVEEIEGPGVIGLQPIIKPGKSFHYSSFCQLTTPQGTMSGNYEMQTVHDEKNFKVAIPEFSLTSHFIQKGRLH